MHEAALRQRVMDSLAAFQRLFGRFGPGGSVVERPGWVAAVVPPLAQASLVNGVVILDPTTLPQALEHMSHVYEAAGATHWGMLLPLSDHHAATLRNAGLAPEATPIAMAAELAELNLDPEPSSLTSPEKPDDKQTQPPTFPTIGRINDQAYGHPDDRLERLLAGFPPHVAHAYGADFGGEPASAALVADHDDDAAVTFVATVPWAQRQGLATQVLRRALEEARNRGQATTTLIASPTGHDLYTALGYHPVATLELWQKRR